MLNVSSVLLSLTVVLFIMALVLAAFWTVRSKASGLKEMSLSAGLGAAGTLAAAAGAASANFLAAGIGTSCFVVGVLLAARAMGELQGRPPRLILEALSLAAGIGGVMYFALAHNNVAGMLVSLSAVYVVVCGLTARDLLTERDPALKSGCRILGVLFALFALMHVVRVIVRPLAPVTPGPGGQLVGLDVVYAFIGLAIVIGWCLGLLWATYNSAEYRLKAAYAELDRFSGIVAHDLKSPLNAVIGNIEAVIHGGAGMSDGMKASFLESAREGALRMNWYINDLLEQARTGEIGRVRETVDAAECLAAAQANLQSVISAAGAEVTAGPLPKVAANHLQLTRVFQNLLDNAIKYRAPDRAPRIEVTARRDGDLARIAFADNGVGIAPADQDRVFRRFVRADATDQASGAGVGLDECRRILKSFGGTITLQSEPGSGSTFTVSLAIAS